MAQCAESTLTLRLNHNVDFSDRLYEDVKKTFSAAHDVLAKSGKIRGLTFALNKKLNKDVFESVIIDSGVAASVEDCEAILAINNFREEREKTASLWSRLMVRAGAPSYTELDDSDPDNVALKWCSKIEALLNWDTNEKPKLASAFQRANIDGRAFLGIDDYDSDHDNFVRIITGLSDDVPRLVSICQTAISVRDARSSLQTTMDNLQAGKRPASRICQQAKKAIEASDKAAYETAFRDMARVYSKRATKEKRQELLLKVDAVAPKWAASIRERLGINGREMPSTNVRDGWKWLQYLELLDRLHQKSITDLQEEATRLSSEYRKVTADLAEAKAWQALLERTENDIDIRQALNGWKLSNRRIGKGTGKRAPILRATARKQMKKCQKAVPVWIMPMSRALDSFDPRKNRFDVLIIDEASQSNVTALALLYYAKKAIVVGDDKQVSPIAVGVEKDQIQALINSHIDGIIPNSQLYDDETSLYDVAASTFAPLMLHEHFRCVPDIIGYSNWLSYDGKIKPLREAGSSHLLPAVVPYRVRDGVRKARTKVNEQEANEIVALMQACFEQPEYDGKTFGVISLLGPDQAQLITSIAYERIEPRDLERRQFLCGDAANFQGDERDVIFLSMVSSGNPNGGPLRLEQSDMRKKRFNVAASRAKDQLWVVYSLDPQKDLKEGDLRRGLIDYARNPKAYQDYGEEIERKSESPFEEEVAKALVSRGYRIVQQWEVGAYRIDMVAMDDEKRIAIECDGERWHSGSEKIRQDMERQAILERLGWTFIRIRGSEYYENKEATISWVCEELESNGIKKFGYLNSRGTMRPDYELLERVKIQAARLLSDENVGASDVDSQGIVDAALSPDAFSSLTESYGNATASTVLMTDDSDFKGAGPFPKGPVVQPVSAIKSTDKHHGNKTSAAITDYSDRNAGLAYKAKAQSDEDSPTNSKQPEQVDEVSASQWNRMNTAGSSEWSDLQAAMDKLHTGLKIENRMRTTDSNGTAVRNDQPRSSQDSVDYESGAALYDDCSPISQCYSKWRKDNLMHLDSKKANLVLKDAGILDGKPGSWRPSEKALQLGCYYGKATTKSGKRTYDTVFLSPEAQRMALRALRESNNCRKGTGKSRKK